MKSSLFSVLLIAMLTIGCVKVGDAGNGYINKTALCDRLWRYDLECALKHLPSQIDGVRELALKLKGENCKETAWNILEWVDKNVRYDTIKASYPPPVIEIVDGNVKVSESERFYQTPAETIMLRKGICGDYAILISALLVASNCTAYVFNISFDSPPDHVAATVKINGSYYVLDQHLPPLDTGSYVYRWRKEGKEIKKAIVYEIGRSVKSMEFDEFAENYRMGEEDVKFLEERISKLMQLNSMKIDEKLSDAVKLRRTMGYRAIKSFRIALNDMAEYYTPVFREEIARFVFDRILENLENQDVFSRARAFDVDVGLKGNDLIVEIYLAT